MGAHAVHAGGAAGAHEPGAGNDGRGQAGRAGCARNQREAEAMSMSLARANRRVEAPLPSSAKKADAKKLRIGAAGDALEREADRVADRVTNDGTMAEWSFAKAGAGRIQRQPT